ncbi:hypothetical protein K2X33_07890 [bacterium]|nr:hypothetical protein [bacterium]
MREHSLSPALSTLKAWQIEGKIEILEVDRADPLPAAHNPWMGALPGREEKNVWGGKKRALPKRDPKATARFGQIAAVIFPMRDTHRLNMSELNDVNHLLRHLTLERTIFVTQNNASFIDGGKRDQIFAALQISVMTPEEAVAHIKKKPLK